ncbi:MAG: hypothetical protein ACXW5U_16825 [Thermoanaerobaculia bacterium]
MTRPGPGFYVGSFSIDGEPQGIGYWECSGLSSRWLAVCSEHLAHQGTSFEASWSGNLSHVTTKMTAVSGAAIITFKIGEKIAASVALAKGSSPVAEAELLKMFVESLRRSGVTVTATTSPEPFQKMLSIGERPLMVVVPFPDGSITDQDHAVVRELSIHLAGAFFSCAKD